ncbi:MAG: CapA family protein [Bacteroides sp.]|nr:CapA family protein [Bacteroides sp.]
MKIAFCGDLMLKTPELHKVGPNLKKLLNQCELRVINFEVPVETQGAVGIHKSGPVHCQSPMAAEWIKNNGFNVITLANNHTLDYGQEGLLKTLSLFKDVTITGIGTYQTAYNLSIVERNDEKIGFLGLTHKEWGCVDVLNPEVLGTACITSPKAIKTIMDAKSKVDRLYVLPHAGVENIDIPLPEWRELYQSFIDFGASGVIASHPHVPQGYEVYNGCPIIYSMGNFLFERPNPEEKSFTFYLSLLVIIDSTDNNFEIIPICYDYEKKEVEVADNEETRDYIKRLVELLSDEHYPTVLEKTFDELIPFYKRNMIAGGAMSDTKKNRIKKFIKLVLGKRVLKPDQVHLLNLFQCESHRWTMMRLLDGSKKFK